MRRADMTKQPTEEMENITEDIEASIQNLKDICENQFIKMKFTDTVFNPSNESNKQILLALIDIEYFMRYWDKSGIREMYEHPYFKRLFKERYK
jgi:hypothetical protein